MKLNVVVMKKLGTSKKKKKVSKHATTKLLQNEIHHKSKVSLAVFASIAACDVAEVLAVTNIFTTPHPMKISQHRFQIVICYKMKWLVVVGGCMYEGWGGVG